MKNTLFIIVTITLIVFSSCKKTTNKFENVYVEAIKVDVQEKYSTGDFNDYFSLSKVIALETNERSVFSNIDRISLYDDKIFILDRKTNAVLIFTNTGRFFKQNTNYR